MSRFKTLLLREWMQHHRGWLCMMIVPPVLMLLALLLPTTVQVEPRTPLPLMVASIVGVSVFVLAITWASVFFQASSLARRDQQDRSIEFWLSLPTSHSASIGATVLMSAVAMPLLALAIGFAFSHLIGLVLVTKTNGIGAWLALPWASVLVGSVATWLRALFGVLLATLWLMPLLLLLMATSAWLKRWGVPILAAALGIGQLVLQKGYGITWIGDTLHALMFGAVRSVLYAPPSDWKNALETNPDAWPVTLQWLAQDALASIVALGQPMFLFALVFSAACFGLLVLRRRQGA